MIEVLSSAALATVEFRVVPNRLRTDTGNWLIAANAWSFWRVPLLAT